MDKTKEQVEPTIKEMTNFFKEAVNQHNVNNKTTPLEYCNILIGNEYICEYLEQLYIYKDNEYILKQRLIDKALFDIDPNLTIAKQKEIKNKIIHLDEIKKFTKDDYNYINFNNGLYDIKNKKLIKHTPELFIKNKIKWNYVDIKSIKHSKALMEVDKTFSKISKNDDEIEQLLFQIIGYSLYRNNPAHHFFMILGEGSNGKSIYLKLLERIFQKKNIATLKLHELAEDYKLASTINKLVNLGDDIPTTHIANSSHIKNVSSGDNITIREIYKEPTQITPYAKHIYTANEMPTWSDRSHGFLRRIVIVPFNAKFKKSDNDFDKNILNKITSKEAIEYILSKAIIGLMEVLENGFIEPKISKKMHATFKKENNSVLQFEEENFKDITLEFRTIQNVYLQYKTYCIESNLRSLSKINFGKEMKKIGYKNKPKTLSGKTSRIWEKEK